MRYIRTVDEAKTLPTGHPGLQAKLLSHQESAMIFNAKVSEGGRAAGMHYHDRDQVYFQLFGTMTAQLAGDVHKIGPNTLVYIPAGLPHCNWNEGPGDEGHLEVIAPATQIGAPLAHMVDPGESATEWASLGPATIVKVDDLDLNETDDGVRRRNLIGLLQSEAVSIDYVVLPSGAAWPEARIHHADKQYFVLSGHLGLQIALTPHVAGPDTLITLPAGVPHRIVNSGSEAAVILEMTTSVGASDSLTAPSVGVSLSEIT